MTIGDHASRIGFFADSHADEAFFLAPHFLSRLCVPMAYMPISTRGEGVRDWMLERDEKALFRMTQHTRWCHCSPRRKGESIPLATSIIFGGRSTFGGGSYFAHNRKWYEWHQLPKDSAAHKWAIAFGEVASHNHFVLDRDGQVFNRSAPVIKLRAEATETEHLELLAVLNSSTACFWLKQVCFNKGGDSVGTEGARISKICGKIGLPLMALMCRRFRCC